MWGTRNFLEMALKQVILLSDFYILIAPTVEGVGRVALVT